MDIQILYITFIYYASDDEWQGHGRQLQEQGGNVLLEQVKDTVPTYDAPPIRDGQHNAAPIVTQRSDIFDVGDNPFRWADSLNSDAWVDSDDGFGDIALSWGGGGACKSHGGGVFSASRDKPTRP